MMAGRPDIPRVPFPVLTRAQQQHSASGGLTLRRYGDLPEDLDISLDGDSPPRMITRLLIQCTRDASGRSVPEEFFWSLTVGKRLECLLLLAAMQSERPQYALVSCVHCGESSEVDFTFTEVLECAPREAVESFELKLGEKNIAMHLPTGQDQLAWIENAEADSSQLLRIMAKSLSPQAPQSSEAFSAEDLERISDAFAEHDPLVAFNLTSRCPTCNATSDHELDLSAIALKVLQQEQSRLMEQVHQFALHYHWTEAEVLRLPPWRRNLYMTMLEKEGARR